MNNNRVDNYELYEQMNVCMRQFHLQKKIKSVNYLLMETAVLFLVKQYIKSFNNFKEKKTLV